MTALNTIVEQATKILRVDVMDQMPYSRTQVYQWQKGLEDRKTRAPKMVDQQSVEQAAKLIMRFPYLSAAKAQAYMIYHRLGVVSHNRYKRMKKKVRKEVAREASRRKLIPKREKYEHVRATGTDQIWAEDFTALPVNGAHFSLAVVVDMAHAYYLGACCERRADAALVEAPVNEALTVSPDGPREYMLSDNGTQYISSRHGARLDAADIVHRRIPACKPWYNGAVECGIKEFKNLFYCLWPEHGTPQSADEENDLLLRVKRVVKLTQWCMNEDMPRPSLGGVTPGDRRSNQERERISENQRYQEQQQRKEVKPWTKTAWDIAREAVAAGPPSNLRIMTNFCFFLKRPLRKLADLHKGVLGNFQAVFSDLT